MSVLNNPNGRSFYFLEDTYPANPTGKVLTIGDIVMEISNNSTYRWLIAEYVHDVTLVPTFKQLDEQENNAATTPMFAGVDANVNDAYLLYVNDSHPDNLSEPDARLRAYGSGVSYFQAFLGTNVGETGQIVGFTKDPSGNNYSDRMPVEYLTDDPQDVRPIYRTTPFYLNRELSEGDVVTLVFYNDRDTIAAIQSLLVKYSSLVKQVNPTIAYVDGLTLESKYVTANDDHRLSVPMNLLNESFVGLIKTFVNYSSGEKREVSVSSGTIDILGLDDIRGDTAGQEKEIVLSYVMAPNEVGEGMLYDPQNPPRIVDTYTVVTAPADLEYAVKLYVIPEFVSSSSGYRLKVYMYSLLRDIAIDVTQHISYGTGGGFDPLLKGLPQDVILSLDLKDVDESLESYNHVQNVTVTLRSDPIKDIQPFSLNYTNMPSREYGDYQIFSRSLGDGTYSLDLTYGLTFKNDWIDLLYSRLMPQYDTTVELEPPMPDTLTIYIGANSLAVDVDLWSETALFTGTVSVGQLVEMEWTKQTPTGETMLLARGGAYVFPN